MTRTGFCIYSFGAMPDDMFEGRVFRLFKCVDSATYHRLEARVAKER